MAFKSYSQSLKKSDRVVFEKKLKITRRRTRRARAPRRGRSYSGGAAKNTSTSTIPGKKEIINPIIATRDEFKNSVYRMKPLTKKIT